MCLSLIQTIVVCHVQKINSNSNDVMLNYTNCHITPGITNDFFEHKFKGLTAIKHTA